MSFSPTSGQVVLKEVFDEGSKPTDEEICEYALRIGIDIENEPHLLYLAQDGLMQALPPGWKPCYDKDRKEIYYFNFKTKKTQWEHPLDDIYRNLVKKARNESVFSDQIDDDSRTTIKEDLKSYEEASMALTNEMYGKPKKLEPLSPLGKNVLKKIPSTLSPLKKINSKDIFKNTLLKPSLPLDGEKLSKFDQDDTSRKITFDENEVRKRPNSSDIRNRRNIGPVEFRQFSKQEIVTPNTLENSTVVTDAKKSADEKHYTESPSVENKGSDSGIVTKDDGYTTEFSVSSLGERDGGGKKELTLTGGGSIFLKTNKFKHSPSSDLVTSSFSKEELSEGLLSPDTRKPGSDLESHPKSILRDQSNQKLGESTSSAEKKTRKDDFEDDRKSVRFNLEKEVKVSDETLRANDSDLASDFTKVQTQIDNLVMAAVKKPETRQIEIDFDDLDINLTDEKLVKVNQSKENDPSTLAEPKKFKPSQMLVQEFRDIFENQQKSTLNLLKFAGDPAAYKAPVKTSAKSSRTTTSSSSSSSINGSTGSNSNSKCSTARNDCGENFRLSENDKPSNNEDVKASQIEVLLDSRKIDSESLKLNVDRLKSDVFDSAFSELVDFAIKKKLDADSSKDDNSMSKILYREKDYLLEEILKEADFDSLEGSEGEKLFVPDDNELEYLEKLESQINLKAQKRKELEKREDYERKKNEKEDELEIEFQVWLDDIKETFERKKKEESDKLKEKFDKWAKEKEAELEKTYKSKYEEESQGRFKELRNELLKKEDAEVEKLKKQLDVEQKERLKNLKVEIEAKESKELADLRKSFESRIEEKKTELIAKHKDEMQEIEKNLEFLLAEKKSQKLKELELARENETLIEAMRLEAKDDYQKQKSNLLKEHEMLLENMRREHARELDELRMEFKNEEESLKKAHLNKLDMMKQKMAPEGRKTCENSESLKADNPSEIRIFEKVRIEKHLLEDKYKTLKEKYIKLKNEAKSTLERKKKKKESTSVAGSETEKSWSSKANSGTEKAEGLPLSGDESKQDAEKKIKFKKQLNHMGYLYNDVSTEDEENVMSPKNLSHLQRVVQASKQLKNEEKQMKASGHCDEKLQEDWSGEEKKLEGSETKKKRQLFSRFKAASTSRINSNNKIQGKEVLSPVENLRRQLKKLEELEDQFPVTTYTDTYMRYPFTDTAQFGSSELEFFKHRIHLERESVKRAKDSLKAQKKSFESRQKELKQKLGDCESGSKAIIDQIYQEEKDLTDMEVSVYRTRALLGEKIIRLKHLEQSLKRISQPLKKDSFSVKGKDFLGRFGVRNQNKDEDKTLSDLSSYSGSSGFSSTDFNETHNVVWGEAKSGNAEQNRRHFQNNMQESSEIIKSLENLNSEIREIWEVLKKQQQSGHETITMLPPPPLIYGDLGWPSFTLSPPVPYRNTVITSTSSIQRPIAQQFKTQITGASNLSTAVDSSLIDRTRSLRDWLKAARNSTPTDAIISSQVTL